MMDRIVESLVNQKVATRPEIDQERRHSYISQAQENLDGVVLTENGLILYKTGEKAEGDESRIYFYDLVNDAKWDLNPDFQGVTPKVLGETRDGGWMVVWQGDVGSGMTAEKRTVLPAELGQIVTEKWWNKQPH